MKQERSALARLTVCMRVAEEVFGGMDRVVVELDDLRAALKAIDEQARVNARLLHAVGELIAALPKCETFTCSDRATFANHDCDGRVGYYCGRHRPRYSDRTPWAKAAALSERLARFGVRR
jgi:hypothetical protein